MRSAAHSRGLRFRLYRKDLPGKPDLVFPKHRVALFVHGCFWHRHPGCSKASVPKSRTDYWQSKFAANEARDADAVDALRRCGWRVFIIWECQTRSRTDIDRILSCITDYSISVFGLPGREFEKLFGVGESR